MDRFFTTIVYTFLVFISLSCKNEGANIIPPGYFFKYKVGGIEYFYDATNRANSNHGVQYNIYYKRFTLFAIPKDGEKISFGTFLQQEYKPESMVVYGSCSHNDQHYSTDISNNVQSNGNCTITKVTKTEIEGIFTYDVYSSKDKSKLSITNGQFRVKL